MSARIMESILELLRICHDCWKSEAFDFYTDVQPPLDAGSNSRNFVGLWPQPTIFIHLVPDHALINYTYYISINWNHFVQSQRYHHYQGWYFPLRYEKKTYIFWKTRVLVKNALFFVLLLWLPSHTRCNVLPWYVTKYVTKLQNNNLFTRYTHYSWYIPIGWLIYGCLVVYNEQT